MPVSSSVRPKNVSLLSIMSMCLLLTFANASIASDACNELIDDAKEACEEAEEEAREAEKCEKENRKREKDNKAPKQC